MGGLQALAIALLAGSALLNTVVAHPGEKHSAEKIKKAIAARDLAVAHANQVSKCVGSAKHNALQSRAAARRATTAQLLREKREIVEKPMRSKRDQSALDAWLNTCHDMSGTHNYDSSTPEATIFTSNATAALTPETIIGPYFVAGEYIRQNVAEDQPGVPIHLDIQFIDVATCEPVPNMLVDIWHANATGVYSGVSMQGQGGLNSTFLRGIQATDHDGVTQFDSVFPGHYMGRTNHIHVVSRRGGQILSNGTYTGGTVNHIGQLYFDQELISAIETMDPYTRNTMALTTNRGDFLTGDEATKDYDPFLSYVMLSDDANDGLLMWITIGVNTTADHNDQAMAAAHYYKGGGVSNNNGPGGFPFPPNGTAPWPFNATGWPSGAPFPTGFPTGGFPPGGFPGFPGPTATATATVKPWGPCIGKREEEKEE
ncbi:Intradiol ring-cleavage dioxygenase [Diplogelasinospora grovesii]|uniref:Intradiol ring-cleavage dioxygenase n=1 Tax=Diplogelasinospora grovesii TaxID=303347 RepID=A0AAN6MWD4_9PEZI|nr:Intradiol ring-cleavage dioxygenase [Diplogelasinospora grovesii]